MTSRELIVLHDYAAALSDHFIRNEVPRDVMIGKLVEALEASWHLGNASGRLTGSKHMAAKVQEIMQ